MATPSRVPEVLPPSEAPAVGFMADYLDPIISRSIEALMAGTDFVNDLLPAMREHWDEFRKLLAKVEKTKNGHAQVRGDLITLVRLFEKLSKGMSHISSMTDELARLRALAAGGADSRREFDVCVEITGKGEVELVNMMLEAAASSGRLCPNCTRAITGKDDAGQV